MIRLDGEYPVTIDTKGRCLMPVALRRQFPEGEGNKFVINLGFENCLNIYPTDVWNRELSKINNLNQYLPEVRKLKRLFLGGQTHVELDGSDRLQLPKDLMEKKGIKKDVILLCTGDIIELWDKEIYDQYWNDNSGDYGALASSLLGNNNNEKDKTV